MLVIDLRIGRSVALSVGGLPFYTVHLLDVVTPDIAQDRGERRGFRCTLGINGHAGLDSFTLEGVRGAGLQLMIGEHVGRILVGEIGGHEVKIHFDCPREIDVIRSDAGVRQRVGVRA